MFKQHLLVSAAFLAALATAGSCTGEEQQKQSTGDAELVDATHWVPFDAKQARECEKNEIPYFVWVHPELSFFSEPIARQLNRKYLNALTATTKYRAYILRYETWDGPLIRRVWRDTGHTKHPFLAFYHGGRLQASFYAINDLGDPVEWKVKVHTAKERDAKD